VGSVGGARDFVRGCGRDCDCDRGCGHARDHGCVVPCWRAIVLVKSLAGGCMQASGLTIEVALPFVAE
jgi:hypothetical protein